MVVPPKLGDFTTLYPSRLSQIFLQHRFICQNKQVFLRLCQPYNHCGLLHGLADHLLCFTPRAARASWAPKQHHSRPERRCLWLTSTFNQALGQYLSDRCISKRAPREAGAWPPPWQRPLTDHGPLKEEAENASCQTFCSERAPRDAE